MRIWTPRSDAGTSKWFIFLKTELLLPLLLQYQDILIIYLHTINGKFTSQLQVVTHLPVHQEIH